MSVSPLFTLGCLNELELNLEVSDLSVEKENCCLKLNVYDIVDIFELRAHFL